MASSVALDSSPAPSPFAVFRNRNFALMWMGQLVSTAGRAAAGRAVAGRQVVFDAASASYQVVD